MSSSNYDWGTPPNQFNQPKPTAQPTSPAQQTPNESNSAVASQPKKSKGPLIGVGAVAAVALVGFAGLSIFQNVRPTPAGPLGWSDEDLASALPQGKITNCEVTPEFWDSVGVKKVSAVDGDTDCIGWIPVAGGGELKLQINSSGSLSPDDSSESLSADGLQGWRKDLTNLRSFESYSPENMCTYFSDNYIFKGSLRVDATCEGLDPIARQIQNIQLQDDFARADHGLFDFSSPEYLEVAPSPVRVTSDYYESTAGTELQEGESAPVDDDDFEGSTIAFRGLRDTSEEVCADMNFTLGREVQSSSYFTIPDLAVVLPTGEPIPLYKEDSLRLNEGESSDISFCGTPNDIAIVGSEAYLTTVDPNDLEAGNPVGGSWKVKMETTSADADPNSDMA